MLVFPQMTTGTVGVYPLTRSRHRRTVQNSLRDGGKVTYADPDWTEKRWELECVGLTGDELGAIQGLFDAATGRLGTFTFLEPAGNLLAESENFAASEWDNSVLVSMTSGIDDPFGGTGAMRATNAGPVAGDVAQVLAVPGDFQYTLSVWIRGAVGLFASTAGGSEARLFDSIEWRRVTLPIGLGLATESVTFGVRLSAGATVDLFGMQVDAQLGTSGYQKTGAGGGVHSHARFGSDVLTVRARGTDVYDAAIRIVSKGN